MTVSTPYSMMLDMSGSLVLVKTDKVPQRLTGGWIDVSKMKPHDLKKLAIENNVDIPTDAKKPDVLQAIETGFFHQDKS